MKQSLSLLIFFSGILSASVHSTIAQDFVVVTSGNGYLLDTDNQVAKKVPFMTVLDVEASRTPYFLVDGGLKIHRDQVHHSASFDYMKENLPGARQALQTLSECFRDGIESDEAIETANRAIDQIKAAFSAQTPATAWFLQTLAALQSDQGDLEAANETLDAADTLLKEIGQVRHVQAFDVFNMRGLLKSQEGDVLEAIRLFNEALLMTSADLGSTHLDAATILTNMSVSYEAIGETAQAVRAQLLATRIRDQVLPPKAIEVPDTYARLGSLKSADGQYQNAIADFKLAAELYRGHSDQAANVITMLLQIGDAYELLKDYEAAELSYIAGNGELNQLDENDALAWRKAIIIRQALLDHGRGDNSEALSHLRIAEDLYDQESPQNEDGQTFENTGNIYASQRDNASAKKYFVKALKIYAETDGETSEAVLQIDELIADLDGARDGSLDDVVMTSDLNAYMFDGEGNFLTAVPPLTVLSWNAYTDETDERYGFYTSPYGDHFGNIDQTQLRRARMLPGYFEASAKLFRSVVKAVADSQSALRTGDTETAKSLLADAIKQCLADVGEKCTLTLWVRMFEVRLLAETEGVEAAADALSALKEVIANRPKGDYAIEMDAQSVAGSLLLKMGEPEAAAEKFRTARDIAIERLGTNHIDVLELNRLIAKASQQRGDIEGAAQGLRDALTIAKAIYQSDAPEVSEIEIALCLVLTQTESLDEALERLQAITDDADKLSPQFRILSFVLLGRVNVLLERYENAKELLPVLLTQLQEMGAATSPPAAAVLSDLGRLAIVDEQWGIAVERLSEAVAMNEKIGQTSSFEYGKAQLSLGIALLGKGEQQKAREQFSAAVETFSRLNRTESTEAKEAASRLAQIKPAPSTAAMTQAPLDEAVAAKLQAASEAYEAGRFDDAKQAYQQILDEASDDFEVPDLARAAAYLGKAKLSLSTDLEKFDDGALETATRDLEKLGTSPDLLRDALLLQACVVVERRQKFLAMDLLNNDLLKIGEALPPKQQFTTLCLRSRALAIDGNAKEAVTTARLALKKAQESFGPQHIYCHSALDALGHALLTDDDETAAVEAFEESRQILRAYLNDTVAYQPFDQLASFLSVTQDSLHEAVSPLRGGGTMEQALTWVLNEKNLLPAFAARDGQIRRLLTTPDQETAYDAWRNQRSQRAAISPSVSTATGSLFEQAQIQELRQAEAAALEKLPPNVQKLLTEPIIPHVTVEDIRKALKPDELFIEIIRLNATEGAHQLALDSYTERDYFAWIVPPVGEGYLSATDLGSSLILDGLYTDDAIPVPERILQDLRDNGEQDAANKFHRSLRSLAEQIWEPISRRSIPESTKTIILSLDGELQHVPWAALPIDGSNRMLIEDYAIRYVSSGRELVQRAREISKRRQSLILSNPDFNADIPGVATAGVSAESLFPTIKAPRLPSADLEANAILADVTRYAGSPPKRLTGKEASQAAVLDVDSPFVMHLATLAINNGDDNTIVVSRSYELTESRVLLEQKSDDAAFRNPFFRCGILLAGFNLAPEASIDIDGILTGAEIIAHDLRGTELVVLSGCPGDLKESGRKIGPELLTEALRLAGARTVIAPTWEIEDRETLNLMVLLYKNLAGGMSKTEALRQAQLSRIKSRTDRYGAAHPFFWASFRVNGRE